MIVLYEHKKLPTKHLKFQEEMKLALTILGYGRYLRRVAEATSLDFSAITAICRWIHDAIEDSPASFATFIKQAAILRDSISLSSGLGLLEIWSTFLADRSPAVSSISLRDLDTYTSRLRGKRALSMPPPSLVNLALTSFRSPTGSL